MALRKASRPAPIRHDFASFATELCPVCGINRLAATLKYPVCLKCRTDYDLDEKLLKELAAYRLIVSQDTINWREKPHPRLIGIINNIHWKATHVMGEWFVALTKEIKNRPVLTNLVKQYLDKVTPVWLERMETDSTKIRRYCFFVAVGTTLITAAYLGHRYAEKKAKEQKEAEAEEKADLKENAG